MIFNKVARLSFLLLSLICFACVSNQEKNVTEEVQEIVYEYPNIVIDSTISTSLQEQNELLPMSELMLEEFLEIANDYEGAKPKMEISFPEEWGVIGFERLPEGREIILAQSENREWKYIIITTGYGVQRVLDAFPVALNLALLKEDALESEVWNTSRADDGSFIVEKQYEWVRSVAEANLDDVLSEPDEYQKKSRIVDTYTVNEMGHVSYLAQEITPEYSAAIFYYTPETKPTDWDDVAPMLQAFCEDHKIIFDEVTENFENITIRDYKLNDIVTVDISPYLNEQKVGVVLLKNSIEPKSIDFASYERMKIEVLRYFKIMMEEEEEIL